LLKRRSRRATGNCDRGHRRRCEGSIA
jgi:hypothetical protein